jgi:ribosomal protein L29
MTCTKVGQNNPNSGTIIPATDIQPMDGVTASNQHNVPAAGPSNSSENPEKEIFEAYLRQIQELQSQLAAQKLERENQHLQFNNEIKRLQRDNTRLADANVELQAKASRRHDKCWSDKAVNDRDDQWRKILQDEHSKLTVSITNTQKRADADRQLADKRIDELQQQLDDSQRQYATLRNMVQVHDSREPGEVTKPFGAINVDIRNVCCTFANNLADIVNPNTGADDSASQQTSLLFDGKLDNVYIPSRLIKSADGTARPLDLFLAVWLRWNVCDELYFVLTKFHPELSSKNGGDLVELWYTQMRKDVSQLDAGRWRALMYNHFERVAIADRKCKTFDEYSQNRGQAFARRITSKLTKEILPVLGLDPKSIEEDLAKLTKGLTRIGAEAITWNHKARGTYLHLDFHPVIVDSEERFDEAKMALGDNYRLKSQDAVVVACVGVGLFSSQAIGDGKEPQRVWQERIQVVTEEYF